MENRNLCKAKLANTGEWITGYYVKGIDEYGKEIHLIFENTAVFYLNGKTSQFSLIDISTLCRCTGAKDKRDKLIFENDILSDDDSKSLVRWDSEKVRFVIDDYGTKGMLMEYGFDENMGEYGVVDTNGFDDFCNGVDKLFEIIGNKYDNNNLLEGNMKENEAIEILKDFDK